MELSIARESLLRLCSQHTARLRPGLRLAGRRSLLVSRQPSCHDRRSCREYAQASTPAKPATTPSTTRLTKDSQDVNDVSAGDRLAQAGRARPGRFPLTSVNKGIGSIVDDAMSASKFIPPRRAPIDSRKTQPQSSPEPYPSEQALKEQSTPGGSAVKDMFDAFTAYQEKFPLQPTTTTTKPQTAAAKAQPDSFDSIFDGMFSNNAQESYDLSIPKQKERVFPYKLNSSLGRSAVLTRHVDVQSAMNMVKATNRANMVRDDWERQRFHERPGLRKKRLKSQRWKARFKTGFEAIIERVRSLQKQGW